MKNKFLYFDALKFLKKMHNCNKYFFDHDISFGYYDEPLHFIEFANFEEFLKIYHYYYDFVIEQYFVYDAYTIRGYNIDHLTKTLKKL